MPNVGAPSKQRIPFTVTIPAGTEEANPGSYPLAIPDSYVHGIEVEVPPGPGGAMGFNLTYGDTQIVPWSQTPSWLKVDDYYNTFEIGAELGNGLKVIGYNTGWWDHIIFLRVVCTPISAYLGGSPGAPVQPIDLSSIGG